STASYRLATLYPLTAWRFRAQPVSDPMGGGGGVIAPSDALSPSEWTEGPRSPKDSPYCDDQVEDLPPAMNRSDLHQLTEARVRESQALLAAGEAAGAYYVAGYAVDCALKACIAKQTDRKSTSL